MPKKLQNIFHEILSFENLYSAYMKTIKSKRYQAQSLLFARNIEENIINLQNKLIWKMWRPSPVHQFFVYEPKKRMITAPAFIDRIVHHAIVGIIEPHIDIRFIHDTYACRTGKGVQTAVLRVQHFVRAHKNYAYYKGDISKFFPSVDHYILKNIIRKYIADADVLYLIDMIIDDHDPGLPIGSLTSQLFANLYLSELDFYIKETMRISHYVRYMDDFVVLTDTVSQSRAAETQIGIFCNNRLNIKINPKSGVGRDLVPFCGYKISRWYIKPNKAIIRRNARKLRKLAKAGNIEKFRESLMSFIGYTKHCNAYTSLESIVRRIKL